MVFHWSFRDSKSLQVSRTLLSILAVLKNFVIWMVSTRPPTSKSSSPSNDPLVTVPKAPITIGIIVTFTCHSFFNSLARSFISCTSRVTKHIYLSIYLSINLILAISVYRLLFISIYLSIYLSNSVHIYLSIYLSLFLYIPISSYPSVSLFMEESTWRSG